MNDTINILLNNSGLMLGVAGYFGYILKDIPNKIMFILEQKYTISFDTNTDDSLIYNKSIQYLQQICPQLKSHIRFHGWRDTVCTVAAGYYVYKLDWFTYITINITRIDQTAGSDLKYTVSCKIIGKNRNKYFDKYKDYINSVLPAVGTFTPINYYDTLGDVVFFRTQPRNFTNCYLPKNIKNQLFTILDNFINNKDFYLKNGIIYKTGILLYGPPGSGKTTIAKAIANELQWPITYISKSIKMYNFTTAIACNKQIILIEDLDCLFIENREKMPEFKNKNDYLDTLTLHDFLNIIDGVLSPNNTIFIATTNYIDRIDPALKRPGRFDYVIEIPYINRETAIEMCRTMGSDINILNDIKFPCSPAIIQNKIQERINKIEKGV